MVHAERQHRVQSLALAVVERLDAERVSLPDGDDLLDLALKRIKPAIAATAIKLFLLPALFLPLAALAGFKNSEMLAILIMVASPTTVSCFVMAKNMGHEGVLTSNVVMLATVFSSVSLTLWIFLLRSFGLL